MAPARRGRPFRSLASPWWEAPFSEGIPDAAVTRDRGSGPVSPGRGRRQERQEGQGRREAAPADREGKPLEGETPGASAA